MKRRKLIAATQTLIILVPAPPARETQVGVNFIDQTNLAGRSTVIGRYFFVRE